MTVKSAPVRRGKPVPLDLRAWVRELLGVRALLKRFDSAEYQPNQKWIDKQHKYWKRRYNEILDTPPDIPSRHYWKLCHLLVLDLKRGQGRPRKNDKVAIHTKDIK